MSVIPAALVAAGFVFGASSAEALHTAKSRHQTAAGQSLASARTAHRSAHSATHHSTRVSKKSAKASAPSAEPSAPLEAAVPEAYGPFPPLEAYDYPRPPCTDHDAVAEATLHDSREETPEPDFTD